MIVFCLITLTVLKLSLLQQTKQCDENQNSYGDECFEMIYPDTEYQKGEDLISFQYNIDRFEVQPMTYMESNSNYEDKLHVHCNEMFDHVELKKLNHDPSALDCSFIFQPRMSVSDKFEIKGVISDVIMQNAYVEQDEKMTLSLWVWVITSTNGERVELIIHIKKDDPKADDGQDGSNTEEEGDGTNGDNNEGGGDIAAAAIGSTVGFIFLSCFCCCFIGFCCVALFLIRKKFTKYGSNRIAPKKNKMCSIMFTDIESSTELWENEKMGMANAMATHNSVIRKYIRKYNGYEVKTIGDAFMIAFKQPWNALKCALEIQNELPDMEWAKCITKYPYCTEVRNSKTNRTIFKGLRVRIGIGMGPAEVETTIGGRYDYHGPMVNRCARIESSALGGTILCGNAFFDAIQVKKGKMKGFEHKWEYVGEKKLKGISDKVRMYCCYQNGRKYSFVESLKSDTSITKIESSNVIEPVTAGGPKNVAPHQVHSHVIQPQGVQTTYQSQKVQHIPNQDCLPVYNDPTLPEDDGVVAYNSVQYNPAENQTPVVFETGVTIPSIIAKEIQETAQEDRKKEEDKKKGEEEGIKLKEEIQRIKEELRRRTMELEEKTKELEKKNEGEEGEIVSEKLNDCDKAKEKEFDLEQLMDEEQIDE